MRNKELQALYLSPDIITLEITQGVIGVEFGTSGEERKFIQVLRGENMKKVEYLENLVVDWRIIEKRILKK
jgi:hypothetical protein